MMTSALSKNPLDALAQYSFDHTLGQKISGQILGADGQAINGTTNKIAVITNQILPFISQMTGNLMYSWRQEIEAAWLENEAMYSKLEVGTPMQDGTIYVGTFEKGCRTYFYPHELNEVSYLQAEDFERKIGQEHKEVIEQLTGHYITNYDSLGHASVGQLKFLKENRDVLSMFKGSSYWVGNYQHWSTSGYYNIDSEKGGFIVVRDDNNNAFDTSEKYSVCLARTIPKLKERKAEIYMREPQPL